MPCHVCSLWASTVHSWLTNRDPGWKKKGILDSDIEEHEYAPSGPAEAAQLRSFYVACYLNLARVYHKNGDTPTSLAACDFALGVDSEADKALLLRAQVGRFSSPSSSSSFSSRGCGPIDTS